MFIKNLQKRNSFLIPSNISEISEFAEDSSDIFILLQQNCMEQRFSALSEEYT